MRRCRHPLRRHPPGHPTRARPRRPATGLGVLETLVEEGTPSVPPPPSGRPSEPAGFPTTGSNPMGRRQPQTRTASMTTALMIDETAFPTSFPCARTASFRIVTRDEEHHSVCTASATPTSRAASFWCSGRALMTFRDRRRGGHAPPRSGSWGGGQVSSGDNRRALEEHGWTLTSQYWVAGRVDTRRDPRSSARPVGRASSRGRTRRHVPQRRLHPHQGLGPERARAEGRLRGLPEARCHGRRAGARLRPGPGQQVRDREVHGRWGRDDPQGQRRHRRERCRHVRRPQPARRRGWRVHHVQARRHRDGIPSAASAGRGYRR